MGVFKWLSGEDNAVVGSLESIQALDASSANLLILDNGRSDISLTWFCSRKILYFLCFELLYIFDIFYYI